MLETILFEDLKGAMKERDKLKVSSLRMVISNIKNKKIEIGKKELGDDEVLQVIKKMAKQHKESMDRFEEAGRMDLFDKERAELAVLEKYMPEQLSDAEISTIIKQVINELGASSLGDMGMVMKKVLEKTGSSADGKIVSNLVKEQLSLT